MLNNVKSPIVFFGYSQLGFDALKFLIETKENIALVVTHQHAPTEHIWFDDVAALALVHQIPVVTPEREALDSLTPILQKIQPALLLSFYYRYMLPEAILAIPSIGAFNMHGSLLPKYRGRAPVNWAILKGEDETGATLHYMEAKPDAGYIVAQKTVTIGADDNAGFVTERVNAAALDILRENIHALKENTHQRGVMDLRQGNYCGGRTREDGCITPELTALEVHNLVRALQPYPQYPAAFIGHDGQEILIHKTRITNQFVDDNTTAEKIVTQDGKTLLACADYWLEILEMKKR